MCDGVHIFQSGSYVLPHIRVVGMGVVGAVRLGMGLGVWVGVGAMM